MRLDPRGCAASLALAMAVLSGCGSTVAGGAGGAAAAGAAAAGTAGGTAAADGGLGGPATGQGTAGLPPAGGVPGAAAGATAGAAGGPGAPGATSSGAPGSPAAGGASLPQPGGSGFGYTTKEIYLGVAYDSTYSQELGQAGVSSGSTTVGDQKQQVQALAADLNRHGGIAGRTVVPVFYDAKGLSSQNDPNTISQAACSSWTEDHHVFAAMTFVVQMDNPTLYGCLSKHHVVFVPFGGDSEATLARFAPYLWAPPALTPERLAPVWVRRLAALGYFTGWDTTLGAAGSAPVKIGLLYGDGLRNGEPQLDTSFVRSVTSALAAQGRHITDSAQISNSQADESAAVLHFRNDGVTHVIGDYSEVNFTASAESQGYKPRYGFASFGGGVALDLFATKDQLAGALGVGWIPAADVENAQDPGDLSPAETHCRSVMAAAGQPTDTRLAWFAMTQACDTFNFLAAAIPRSGLQQSAFPAATDSLGPLPPVSTFGIAFPHGRPDGATSVRDVGYRSDCSCFAYLDKTDQPA